MGREGGVWLQQRLSSGTQFTLLVHLLNLSQNTLYSGIYVISD